MNAHLLLILQTHSLGDNQQNGEKRYCGEDKTEILRRCTLSLIESVNYAVDLLPDTTFELVVFDDHSSDTALQHIKDNISLAKFKTSLEHLNTRGIMPSILKCYEYGRDHGKDWVYFVQDDYLYQENSIYDMLITIIQTSVNLNNYASIYPYDDPYRYIPINTHIPSHIIRSQNRHWRTYTMTSSCFMTHHKVITKEWDLFYAMGTHKVDNVMERDTINKLFTERGYFLLIPIPSLALHMQYEIERDPIIDWRSWWDKYNIDTEVKINKEQKNLLHIGFGGIHIKDCVYADDLLDYNEITVDVNKNYSPDIVCDIKDLSIIPNESVDCIYSSHTLEHLDYFSVPIVLKQFNRILKQNGFARNIVPNIKVAGMYLVQDKLLDKIYDSPGGPVTAYDLIYSHRYTTRKHNYDFMFHKTGFTRNIVETIAKEYNLNLSCTEKNTDLIITLTKC